MKATLSGIAIVILLSTASSVTAQWTFTSLGHLPGGDLSFAYGVSDDGMMVVGMSRSTPGEQAYYWTPSTGMVGLGDFAGGDHKSWALGMSGDGTTIVGFGTSADGKEAFAWTSATGMLAYGDLPGGTFNSRFRDGSSDGSVLIGFGNSASGREAIRWTQSTGMIGLGDLPGGTFNSNAWEISDDGSTIVGIGNSSSGREAMYWTQTTGMVGMGDLSGGIFDSRAEGTSTDGSVIVGSGHSALGREAMYWTQATGMIGLGDLSGGVFDSMAHGVSGDGSIIVGYGESEVGREAFIWNQISGMQSLQDFLSANGVTNLGGWHLEDALAISVDGNTIVGQGINPNGLTEAWIATYAEPVLASPVGVAISTGSLVSGELPEILDSDDQYLVIDPTFGPFRYQLAYTVDAISPTATSSTIEFNCESHTFNIVGTVEQKVELFNYLTGEFESIDTRLTTSNDSMVSIIVNGNPSRFVEAGTGAMQARLSYENSGSFWVFVFANMFLPFETRVDQVFWTITP